MNKMLVSFKNQYGTETVVPACPVSALFANIAGTKTLSKPVLESIKALGFTIDVQQIIRSI